MSKRFEDNVLAKLSELNKGINDFKQELKGIKDELFEVRNDIQRLDITTSNLTNDIINLKTEVNNIGADLSATKDIFNKYVKKDATDIEKELKNVIQNHFRPHIYQNILFEELPMKNFYDCSGNLITEFDYGAFIKFHNNQIIHTLIVEAKHSVKTDKVVKKLHQIHKVIQLLTKLKSKQLVADECTHKFNNMLDTYNEQKRPLLNSIDPKQILLYIGGPTWEKDAYELIIRIQSDNKENLMTLSEFLIKKYRLKDEGKKHLDVDEFYKTLLILQNRIGAMKLTEDKKYYEVRDNISFTKSTGGGEKKSRIIKKHKVINLY